MINLFWGENLYRNRPITKEVIWGTSVWNQEMLGMLTDPLSCKVKRNREGLFNLSMTYPKTGANAEKLQTGRWLEAPAGGTLGNQYFCIVDCDSSTSDSLIYVEAVHASYNAQEILAAPFQSGRRSTENLRESSTTFYAWHSSVTGAIRKVSETQMGKFTLVGYTDNLKLNAAKFTEPVSLWDAATAAVEGREDLMVLGDGLGLKIWKAETKGNPSFVIRYGGNMLDWKSRQSFPEEGVYTHIFPYVKYGEDQCRTYNDQTFRLSGIPSQYANAERIRAVDFSNLYGLEEEIQPEGLELLVFGAAIDLYLEDHLFQTFPNEISVEAVPDSSNTYELGLSGDVYYDDRDGKTRVVITSLEYDVLEDQVTQIGIGRVPKGLTERVADLMKARGKG